MKHETIHRMKEENRILCRHPSILPPQQPIKLHLSLTLVLAHSRESLDLLHRHPQTPVASSCNSSLVESRPVYSELVSFEPFEELLRTHKLAFGPGSDSLEKRKRIVWEHQLEED